MSKQLVVMIADRVGGPIAVDKDNAAQIREQAIFPTLRSGGTVVLDFSGITVATQSFVHAMISSVIRREGKDVLRRMVFRNADPSVRSTIQLVVRYSSVDYAGSTPTQETVVERIQKAEAAVLSKLPQWYPDSTVREVPGGSELVDALVFSHGEVVAVQVKYVRGNVNAANLAQVIERSGSLFTDVDQVGRLLVVLVSDGISEPGTRRLLERVQARLRPKGVPIDLQVWDYACLTDEGAGSEGQLGQAQVCANRRKDSESGI